MDLITFLRERIDEDEHWAHMAEAGWPPENGLAASEHPEHYPFTATDITPSKAAFIRQHSPARVLREVEAKRNILTTQPQMYVLRCFAAVYSDHKDYDPDWAIR